MTADPVAWVVEIEKQQSRVRRHGWEEACKAGVRLVAVRASVTSHKPDQGGNSCELSDKFGR